MMNLGAYTGSSLRRAVRSEVASEYPSVVQYRRILTPFQEEQAKAGQFHLGSVPPSSGWWESHKDKPGIYIPIIIGLILYFKK